MEQRYLEWDDSQVDEYEIKRRFFVLAIYDIIDNKRRRKMVKVLESFGVRVQKSAFECVLDKKRYDQLLRAAPRCIDHNEDSLRIYLLTGKMSVIIWGCETEIDTGDTIIL